MKEFKIDIEQTIKDVENARNAKIENKKKDRDGSALNDDVIIQYLMADDFIQSNGEVFEKIEQSFADKFKACLKNYQFAGENGDAMNKAMDLSSTVFANEMARRIMPHIRFTIGTPIAKEMFKLAMAEASVRKKKLREYAILCQQRGIAPNQEVEKKLMKTDNHYTAAILMNDNTVSFYKPAWLFDRSCARTLDKNKLMERSFVQLGDDSVVKIKRQATGSMMGRLLEWSGVRKKIFTVEVMRSTKTAQSIGEYYNERQHTWMTAADSYDRETRQHAKEIAYILKKEVDSMLDRLNPAPNSINDENAPDFFEKTGEKQQAINYNSDASENLTVALRAICEDFYKSGSINNGKPLLFSVPLTEESVNFHIFCGKALDAFTQVKKKDAEKKALEKEKKEVLNTNAYSTINDVVRASMMSVLEQLNEQKLRDIIAVAIQKHGKKLGTPYSIENERTIANNVFSACKSMLNENKDFTDMLDKMTGVVQEQVMWLISGEAAKQEDLPFAKNHWQHANTRDEDVSAAAAPPNTRRGQSTAIPPIIDI